VDQLIRTSQVLVMQCTALVSNPFVLPESVAAVLRPEMARLETGFGQMLDTFVTLTSFTTCEKFTRCKTSRLTPIRRGGSALRAHFSRGREKCGLVLFAQGLGVRFAVRIKEFLSALLPRRSEFGRCNVPVRPAFLGNGP
jgi:hypothetical protein